MPVTIEALYTEALALPADQREKLADQIRQSLTLAERPKGIAVIGRGKGMLVSYIDDDEHLKDFAEYLS